MDREDDAVDAGALGTAQQRADVVWVLERVEYEDERRLAALLRTGEDVVEAGELSWLDDERDALVAVEASERGQRAALDLDDRDAEVRRVEDDLFERGAAIRNDEQPPSRSARDERLLDGPATRDELLVGLERVGGRECRGPRSGRSILE
jgi:hypothetical protein